LVDALKAPPEPPGAERILAESFWKTRSEKNRSDTPSPAFIHRLRPT
jgi:hypothetical protein